MGWTFTRARLQPTITKTRHHVPKSNIIYILTQRYTTIKYWNKGRNVIGVTSSKANRLAMYFYNIDLKTP